MKKTLIILIVIWMVVPTMCTHATSPTMNGTWIWNPWSLMKNESKIIKFLVAQKVKQVYIQIDTDIPIKTYQQFISKANQKKIEVHALDGAANWIASEGEDNLTAFFKWVVNYQAKSKANQKFSGIHLDIEPYLHDSWNQQRSKAILSYQTTITKASKLAKSINLPFAIDMPFWFDEITYQNKFGTGNLAKWAIHLTDSTTVMAYRNTAKGENGIIGIIKQELAYAQAANKPVVIAVETGKSDEGANISFYQSSNTFMIRELNKVSKAYPNYQMKFAIHYLDSWMLLK